jgi:hypothetical protein
MLSFHAHLKVFVATAPCDLRANFNGLWTAAQERLGEDPKSGALQQPRVLGVMRKHVLEPARVGAERLPPRLEIQRSVR